MHGALVSALLAAFVIGSAFPNSVTAGEVTFVSACECQGQKSGSRWPAKTDPSPVPLDKSAIQPVTPSQICEWKGPESNVPLTPETDTRIAAEQKWYNLTGRVVGVKVEGDGDITLVLKMPTARRQEVLVPKFLSAPYGASSGRLFSVGRRRAFLSRSRNPKSSKCASSI